MKGGKSEIPEKNPRSKGREPTTYDARCRIRTRATMVGGERTQILLYICLQIRFVDYFRNFSKWRWEFGRNIRNTRTNAFGKWIANTPTGGIVVDVLSQDTFQCHQSLTSMTKQWCRMPYYNRQEIDPSIELKNDGPAKSTERFKAAYATLLHITFAHNICSRLATSGHCCNSGQ